MSDVRAQPPKQDQGYDTQQKEAEGDLPDMTAIIHTLMLHRELIVRNRMIYLIVDNRSPAEVPHWPAFAAWWASRRCLVGPQEEASGYGRARGCHPVLAHARPLSEMVVEATLIATATTGCLPADAQLPSPNGAG